MHNKYLFIFFSLFMEITAYTAQVYQRSKARYVLFSFIVSSIILISLLYQNYLGVIIVFLFLGGYLLFSVHSTQTISISYGDQFLRIGKESYNWQQVQGFFLQTENRKHYHLTLLIDNKLHNHTLHDTDQRIQEFILGLPQYTRLLAELPISRGAKIARKLKL